MSDLARRFLELHKPGDPLLLPNPWDAGSARVLARLGFRALATTSSGFAGTLGRLDGSVTREEALAHAAAIVRATDLPVSADLENGFGDSPEEVALTAAGAVAAGLAGFSIEDFTGREEDPIYPLPQAAERVAAAAAVAHAGPLRVVLTGRCENHLHGRHDLQDTIERLSAYAEAGADVVYAPGVTAARDIAAILEAVPRPINVLAMRGAPTVSELAELGVSRISVGGAFAFASLEGLVRAARELLEQGTYGFAEQARVGREAAGEAFGTSS